MKFPSSFPKLPFNNFDYAILRNYVEFFSAKDLLMWIDDSLAEQGCVTIFLKPPAHLNASAVTITIFKLRKRIILFNSVRWMANYGFAVPNLHEVSDEEVIKTLGIISHTNQSEAISKALHDIYNGQPNAISFKEGVIHALSM